MNRMQALDMEIQRCETEYYALNSESTSDSIQRKPYIEISAVATAIVTFLSEKGQLGNITEFTQEERHTPKEHENEKAYTYRQIRMELNNESIQITDLIFDLGVYIEQNLSQAATEQTIKPLGLSIQSWHEHTPRVVILLAETKPPNHYTVILLGLKGDSSTTLYDQCKRMSVSTNETVELFRFFYTRFINIMSNGTGQQTLITDGAEDQERLEFCKTIIDDSSIELTTKYDEKNTCFERCKTLTKETYRRLFGPCTRYLPVNDQFNAPSNEETIWIRSHPFFPDWQLDIIKKEISSHFTLKHTHGTNQESPGATHIVNCHTKYTLFYCICAFMERQGEDSFVCKKLRSAYGKPLFSTYTPTESAGGTKTYDIPQQNHS